MGRGYNPNLVNYRDSEYHYGSDFEGDHDFEEPETEKSSESEISDAEEESDELKPESDVELEPVLDDRESFTPVPLWVQFEDTKVENQDGPRLQSQPCELSRL